MKYLGIDYGLKRVGLAISEGELATPWKIIEVKGLSDALKKINEIVKSEGVDKVIIGMPEGDMGRAVRRFISDYKGEIEMTDETLSSKNAGKLMIEMGLPRQKRKLNDSFAAAAILQEYLDRQ